MRIIVRDVQAHSKGVVCLCPMAPDVFMLDYLESPVLFYVLYDGTVLNAVPF